MAIHSTTTNDKQQLDGIMTVTHYENGKRFVRSYDFRIARARDAYLKFASWALGNGIEFTSAPTYSD